MQERGIGALHPSIGGVGVLGGGAAPLAQHFGGERRAGGEGDKGRDGDGARHDPAKFDEEAAHLPRHEGERHEDRDQRDRGGEHGEGHLPRALDRGDERALAIFDAALDVFEHHDGVIHHEADGQEQRQQGQRVERKTPGADQHERAYQRHRDGDRGDERGAEAAQEEQDDQHHEAERDDQRVHHFADRGPDKERVIRAHEDLHPFGQGRADLVDLGADGLGNLQRVGLALALHGNADRVAAIAAGDGGIIGNAGFDPGDVAEADRVARDPVEHHIAEVVDALQAAVEPDAQLAVLRGHFAGGQFDIVAAQGVLDIGHGKLARGHGTAVEPDAHRKGAFAIDPQARHPVERGEAVGDEPVEIISDLGGGHAVRDHGEAHHRIGVGIAFLDLGRVGLFGQVIADAAHRIAHVIGRDIDIAPGLEFDGDAGLALTALGADRADARDRGDRAFDGFGDVGVDHFGGGAEIARGDGDHGVVDIGQFADRDAAERAQPEDDQQKVGDRGKHRAAHGDVRQCHDLISSLSEASPERLMISTSEPSRTRCSPRVTT